jgi:transposase-like protein
MDAIHYNVWDNGVIAKKAVYIVLAYTMDGFKEVLGMYVGENESSTALNQLEFFDDKWGKNTQAVSAAGETIGLNYQCFSSIRRK